ncbi:hypothetical protein [Nonomuraea maheshkhaliensis]
MLEEDQALLATGQIIDHEREPVRRRHSTGMSQPGLSLRRSRFCG